MRLVGGMSGGSLPRSIRVNRFGITRCVETGDTFYPYHPDPGDELTLGVGYFERNIAPTLESLREREAEALALRAVFVVTEEAVVG